MDAHGCDIDEKQQRKAEQILQRSAARSVSYDRLHELVELRRVKDFYLNAFNTAGFDRSPVKVCIRGNDKAAAIY